MNDGDLARVIHALTGAYLEMNDFQRRRFLDELMRIILGMTGANEGDGFDRPFFSETVRPPCCERPIKIELSCQA